MTSADLARVRRLVEQAHDLAPLERASFLERACGEDRGLRGEVELVLSAAESSPGFLEPPPMLASADARLEPGASIGAFRLLRRIASGGMGTIWEAEQSEPRRKVALKTLRHGGDSSESARRFRHEAEILARLRHPHVAQIYASGIHAQPAGELPWFAMEFVDGASPLTEFARSRDLRTNRRLELFATLCDAVQHGHERGVIHRDLKPSNVLVDAAGTLKVIDFGVARLHDGDERSRSFATQTGRILGTLQYMAPEQIAGVADGVDTRCDVYALGVMLYELLTDQLPYDVSRAPLAEAARVITEHAPRRPSTSSRRLSPDLDAITLKALEKDRARRYASAAALAEDVRRFLRHEPVEARPPSVAYQARVFARRHRALATALLVVFVTLSAATITSLRFAWRAGDAEREALDASNRALDAAEDAIAQRDIASEREYAANIAAANGALRARDVATARRRLASCPPELRGFEWWHLARRADDSLWTRTVLGRAIGTLCWHPDGTRFFVATTDGSVEARDGVSGALLERREGSGRWTGRMSISEDGRRLAFASDRGTAFVLSTSPLCVEREWPANQPTTTTATISPDGRTIARGGLSGPTMLLDVESGAAIGALEASEPQLGPVAFSPDGALVAGVASDMNTVMLWDVATRARIARLHGHRGYVSRFAFDADGRTLYSSSHDHEIRSWSLPGGELVDVLREHQDIVWDLDLDRGSSRMASCGWDRTIRIWDRGARALLSTWIGHETSVTAVAFSPDGSRVVSGDEDGELRLWRSTSSDPRVLPVRGKWIWTLDFFPDGASVLAVHGGLADRLATLERRTIANYVADGAPWLCGARSPGGDEVALCDEQGWLERRGADGVGRLARWRADGQSVRSVAWHPSGSRIAIGGDGGLAIVFARDGERLFAFESARGALGAVAFSPDGASLACAGDEGVLTVLDAADGTVRYASEPLHARATRLTWSADGSRIALALDDGRAVSWNHGERRIDREFVGHEAAVTDARFTPDGSRLVTGSTDRTVRFWDPASARELAAFSEHSHYVHALAISPDGSTIASGSSDSTLRWWDAGSPAERWVDELRERRALAREVRAVVLERADAASELREAALREVGRLHDEPVELARKAWSIVRVPGPSPARLELALALATTAARQAPDQPLAAAALALVHGRCGDWRAAAVLLEARTGEHRTLRAIHALARARLGDGAWSRAEIEALDGEFAEPAIVPMRDQELLLDEARAASVGE